MKPTDAQRDYYIRMRGSVVGSRLSMLGIAGIILVVLKIGGWVDWSWTAVLSPFWGGALYFVSAALGILAYGASVTLGRRDGL